MSKKLFYLLVFLMIFIFIVGCSNHSEITSSLLGSEAPGFELDNANGEVTSLDDFRGQPVLLYFHMAVG